jgi:hypothetical protein
MAAQNEVDALKHDWASDPCWDIEETEGFEDHREELLRYRLAKESEWRRARVDKIRAKAAELGTDNMKLAAYVMRLEERITRLEERI